MSDEKWPQWPEDQLVLPDLGSDPPEKDRRDRDDSLTKGGRVKEGKDIPERGRALCPKCGWPKTIGLPCTVCSRWSGT